MTLPNVQTELMWLPEADRGAYEDSLVPVCGVGNVGITDLESVFVYASPTSGGGYRRVYSEWVGGREGEADTISLKFPNWVGAHFYVTAKRKKSGESCTSSVAYVGTITAVEIEPPFVRKVEWYDVRGRRLPRKPTTGGVYFWRMWVGTYWVKGKSVVIP